MSSNPYEAPSSFQQLDSPYFDGDIDLPPKDRVLVEAIVRDAGQYWRAILLCVFGLLFGVVLVVTQYLFVALSCLFCSLLGLIVMIPWYGGRLTQWTGIASRFPMLTNAGALTDSLSYRFQRARTKLILGMWISGLLLFGLFVLLVLPVVR